MSGGSRSDEVALPLWIRSLLALERGTRKLDLMVRRAVEELLLTCTAPESRDGITAAIYARQPDYSRGGRTFARGLMDWEDRFLDRMGLGAGAHILLGGAGGGRELVALVARGHRVTAFEPSAPLAADLAREAAAHPGTVALTGGYNDLVDAVQGRGPLVTLKESGPFDAVMLGWGSFAHVMGEASRRAVLMAARALAPEAPLLLSYLPPSTASGSAVGRRTARFRAMLKRLGAPAVVDPGDHFVPWAGFHHEMTPADIEALAAATGYVVDALPVGAFGYAYLRPAR